MLNSAKRLTFLLSVLAPKCPDTEYSFSNAEAAFQALKYWDQAKSYEHISGEEAFERKKWRRNVGKADRSYAGFGSNWVRVLLS